MREVVLRVDTAALDEVLDGLLPIVPGGVRETPLDDDRIELVMRGDRLPSLEQIAAAAGPARRELAERHASDDWRERRVADYRERTVGGRLVVRPSWAPAPDPRLIDIVLADSGAFGEGEHPTTNGCLELLLEMRPDGPFADLGCGTGVLAILATHLGWGPVTALDVQPASVDAARENAALNRATIDVRVADLVAEPPPDVEGFAANVPPDVHAAIAGHWHQHGPTAGIVSGFGHEDADAVIGAYAVCGLCEQRRVVRAGWVIAALTAR